MEELWLGEMVPLEESRRKCPLKNKEEKRDCTKCPHLLTCEICGVEFCGLDPRNSWSVDADGSVVCWECAHQLELFDDDEEVDPDGFEGFLYEPDEDRLLGDDNFRMR
jgi:hypothetical protein